MGTHLCVHKIEMLQSSVMLVAVCFVLKDFFQEQVSCWFWWSQSIPRPQSYVISVNKMAEEVQ